MAVIYPEAWNVLEAPHSRGYLIAYLKDACDRDLYRSPDKVAFLMHFVFDDSGDMYWPDANDGIGWVLLDDKEVDALRHFVEAFNTALGPRSKPVAKISASEWSIVAVAARHALETLVLHGEPEYTDE